MLTPSDGTAPPMSTGGFEPPCTLGPIGQQNACASGSGGSMVARSVRTVMRSTVRHPTRRFPYHCTLCSAHHEFGRFFFLAAELDASCWENRAPRAPLQQAGECGMACADVCGALQRLTVDVLSGGFGHVGDGGHGTHIGRLSDCSGCMRVSITADLCSRSVGWPVGSHTCDPGMKRD